MSLVVSREVLKTVCEVHGILPESDPLTLLEKALFMRDVQAISNQGYLEIIQDSLPGAIWMYKLMQENLAKEPLGYYKKCFHGFEKVEKGHVIRACYGTSLNQVLNQHYGLVLKRVAPGRVVAFTPERFAQQDARALLFSLSGQNAHEDDTVQTPPIQDDTILEIPKLDAKYPRAMQHLYGQARTSKLSNAPVFDLSHKDPDLFREQVELLSIAPYRLLLETYLGVEFAMVNCCNGATRPKPQHHQPSDLHEAQWHMFTSPDLQLLAQEPSQLDC